MSFTDEDLAWAKSRNVADHEETIGFDDLHGLIARLEASEQIVTRYSEHQPKCPMAKNVPPCNCGYPKAYELWRKSKGETA